MSPIRSQAKDLSEVGRRVLYLNNLQIKAPDRASIVGVMPAELPAYIQTLVEMGLLDTGERLTPAGNLYRTIANKPGQDKRALWRTLGGDEARLDRVIAELESRELIEARDGRYQIVD